MKRVALLILLAACTTAGPPLPPMMADTCGATDYADMIGQDATALEKVLIMRMVRVIRPGDMVTQDFRPERINFMINDAGVIDTINCG